MWPPNFCVGNRIGSTSHPHSPCSVLYLSAVWARFNPVHPELPSCPSQRRVLQEPRAGMVTQDGPELRSQDLDPELSRGLEMGFVDECREEQFPCTRLYSVHKPVKQCISYLCVTSVRRMYIINKEVCSRVVCKEDEVMQDEICRQLAGIPPRRLRRSGQPRGPPCRWGQNKELNKPDAL
uniref:Microfibril associated protein 5 n=1 Tax=Chelonoidis abingdonii TaxID=106734 RepID=A0A8C0H0L7_CHEAB